MVWGALRCCLSSWSCRHHTGGEGRCSSCTPQAAGEAICSLHSCCLQSNITSLSPSLEGWLLGKNTLMRQLVKGRNRLAWEPEELCDC